MEIRRLRPGEWEALRDIRLRALATDPDAFGGSVEEAETYPDEVWQARASDPDSPVFVAESPGGLIGMAIGAPAPDGRRAAALYSMWVAPQARRLGVGGALIDAVVEWARATGYPSIGLGVTLTNATAIALYERKGFVDTGERWGLREGADTRIAIMGQRLTDDP